MEKILEEILKELKYQSKMMEYLYEKKDESKHNINDHIKRMQDMMLNNPMIKADPVAIHIMKQMFETIPGGESK